jgi:hypothetical protein
MQLTLLNMQPHKCKSFLSAILLFSGTGLWCCIGISRVWANNLETEIHQEKQGLNPANDLLINPDQSTLTSETEPKGAGVVGDHLLELDAVSLEEQTSDPYQPSVPKEPLLDQSLPTQEPNNLFQESEEGKQPSVETETSQELGLRVRRRPLEQLPIPIDSPVAQRKPVGYLKARVGYFYSTNIFSEQNNPTNDGLIFSGLTLASAYFPLSTKTYISGSIDGNLIRYGDESEYSYNQLRFNLGLYQQLSRQMYGEINFSNQQLFYSNNSEFFQSGERFLNENSVRLSVGRRDPLSRKLTLDTAYELSINIADPARRSRVINSFWVSLNYFLEKPLQASLNYQLNLSDFTERDREDQFHRIYGNLNYRLSNTSNVNLQTGFTLGNSTNPNIDFDGWFFGVNYNLELGRF